MIEHSLNINFLDTERLVLKRADPTMAQQYLDYHIKNKERFAGALPAIPPDFYTIEVIRRLLWQQDILLDRLTHLRYFLFDSNDRKLSRIIGDLSASNIQLNKLSSCSIGFTIDKDYEGRGLISEGLEIFISLLFNNLGLHRLEAYTVQENIASQRVLDNAGFREEGVCYSYIKIGKEWKDHLRYSLINPLHENE